MDIWISEGTTCIEQVYGCCLTTGARSGVKLSGPQKNVFTPASKLAGTRSIAWQRKAEHIWQT